MTSEEKARRIAIVVVVSLVVIAMGMICVGRGAGEIAMEEAMNAEHEGATGGDAYWEQRAQDWESYDGPPRTLSVMGTEGGEIFRLTELGEIWLRGELLATDAELGKVWWQHEDRMTARWCREQGELQAIFDRAK